MNTTIFCTFDHQDLADLAMGHIRAIGGVRTIHYIYGPNSRLEEREHHGAGAYGGAVAGVSGSGFGLGAVYGNTEMNHAHRPRPVTVKITCSEDAKNNVVNRLVNQHAFRIIVTPH